MLQHNLLLTNSWPPRSPTSSDGRRNPGSYLGIIGMCTGNLVYRHSSSPSLPSGHFSSRAPLLRLIIPPHPSKSQGTTLTGESNMIAPLVDDTDSGLRFRLWTELAALVVQPTWYSYQCPLRAGTALLCRARSFCSGAAAWYTSLSHRVSKTPAAVACPPPEPQY
jgi:hypothetical protein